MRRVTTALTLAGCVVAVALCPGRSRAAGTRPLRTLPPSHTIAHVPYVQQQPNGCGVAALESVLRCYGVSVTQRDIAREIALPNGEILNLDLKLYARRKGFRAESRRGDAALLKAWIARDAPVICQVRLGGIAARRNHFIVVFGYDERKLCFIAHTGERAAEEIPYLDFARAWGDAQNWMLVIRPPDQHPGGAQTDQPANGKASNQESGAKSEDGK